MISSSPNIVPMENSNNITEAASSSGEPRKPRIHQNQQQSSAIPRPDDKNGSLATITSSTNQASSRNQTAELKKPIIPKDEAPNYTSSQAKPRVLAKSLLHESPTSQQRPKKPSSPSSPHSPSLSPWCQNCQTSNTPLWRRDESGQILCNACGLFLKLHGRPRPISLKTDTIKSRNRSKNNHNGTQIGSPGGANMGLDTQSKQPTSDAAIQKPAAKAKSRKRGLTSVISKISDQKGTSSATSSPSLTPASEIMHDSSNSPSSISSVLRDLRHGDSQATDATPSSASSINLPLPATSAPASKSLSVSQQEPLPSLMASLDPKPNSTNNQQTPYVSWVPSPSFNPLTRNSQLPTLNSPAASPFISATSAAFAPLNALKDGDGNPFSPLRPPTTHGTSNPMKSLLSDSHSPAIGHHPPSLQAITSPLLLASTPSSHLHAPSVSSSLLNPPKHLYQVSDGNKEGDSGATGSSQGPFPRPMNSAKTALDHLTSAACTSPYLAPVRQKSDSRLPPIVSPYDSQHTKEDHGSLIKEISLSTPRGSEMSPHHSVENSQNEHDSTSQALQTRVSELELVNDLLRSRITELETSENSARRSEAIVRESEILLRVRVNKLEGKIQSYLKRIKTLNTNLQALKGVSSPASLDGLLEDDDLDFSDDDVNHLGAAKLASDRNVASELKPDIMTVANANGSNTSHEGLKPTHLPDSLEDNPSKKFKSAT